MNYYAKEGLEHFGVYKGDEFIQEGNDYVCFKHETHLGEGVKSEISTTIVVDSDTVKDIKFFEPEYVEEVEKDRAVIEIEEIENRIKELEIVIRFLSDKVVDSDTQSQSVILATKDLIHRKEIELETLYKLIK